MCVVMFCSLHSSNSEQDEDGQDDRQKLIKDEPVHSKKTETSQLVQEEKAETGNVCDNIILRVESWVYLKVCGYRIQIISLLFLATQCIANSWFFRYLNSYQPLISICFV